MERLLADIRFGAKLFFRDRGFTAAALLTLALCIGANAAMFSVVNSVLLKPLPFNQPEQIVTLYNSYPNAGSPRTGASGPDIFDRVELPVFQEVAGYQDRGLTIGEEGRPERITGLAVTPSFFRLLGVAPHRGRWFDTQEGEVGNHRVVMLSYALWQQNYSGSDDVIGRELRINGVPYSIVGVMPRGFMFGRPDFQLWLPLTFTPAMRADDQRHSNNFEMIARLKPGVTIERAQTEIDALNRRIDERLPQFSQILREAGFTTIVVNYRQDLVRDIASTLYMLQAGVLLVLLLGCVNIANLLLVRSTARHRELATRSTLGAPRARLVRQLITESLLLAGIGGGVGLFAGYAITRLFSATAADLIPRGTEISMDWQVIAASVALSLLAGLTFGTIPVVRVVRADLSSVFRDEGRTGTASRSTMTWRAGLVVAQVATAFVLLTGAGLLILSFVRTLRVDTGFAANNILTAAVDLRVTKYPNGDARLALTRQLLERARAIPGVTSTAITDLMPFASTLTNSVIIAEGYVRSAGESLYSPWRSTVSAGYFETMGIEITRGRSFGDSDTESSLPVVVVDEWLANRYWAGQDPIGKRLAMGAGIEGEEINWLTIVGVVRDVRMTGFASDESSGHFYLPVTQSPVSRMYVTIRTGLDPAVVTNALRASVVALDPDMPLFDVRPMTERLSESLTTDRLRLTLLVGFAGIALLLAAVGIYGVLAYTVSQRTSEIGIRLALGGSRSDVFWLVLRQGIRLTAIGLGAGAIVSVVLTRSLSSMLYDVQPHDPLVFALVLTALAAVAMFACLIPARRATRVEPGQALRS